MPPSGLCTHALHGLSINHPRVLAAMSLPRTPCTDSFPAGPGGCAEAGAAWGPQGRRCAVSLPSDPDFRHGSLPFAIMRARAEPGELPEAGVGWEDPGSVPTSPASPPVALGRAGGLSEPSFSFVKWVCRVPHAGICPGWFPAEKLRGRFPHVLSSQDCFKKERNGSPESTSRGRCP